MKIICNEIFNVPVKKVHFSETSTISGQDYDIGELLQRWSQGQRLNVHMRPIEFETEQNKDDAFKGDMLPNFEDITELEQYKQEHEERKSEFIERIKAKKASKEAKDKVPENSEQREVHEN